MLKATIDADILKESIDAISALVTECRLHTDENGISTRAVDTANVAMISLLLKKEAFSSFAATRSELGIDIAKMKNIFGMMAKNDLITLELTDDIHKLQVSFQGYKYSITLLDENTIRKDPNPPTIELPGKVAIPELISIQQLRLRQLFPISWRSASMLRNRSSSWQPRVIRITSGVNSERMKSASSTVWKRNLSFPWII